MLDSRKDRRPTPLLALATMLLIAACDGKSPTAPKLGEGDVSWETLYQMQTSGIDDFRRGVIRVEGDLEELWDEIGTTDPQPVVDFNDYMVVVAASGSRSDACYDIEVTAATSDGTDLTVTVTERTPTADCVCAEVIVQPVVVIQVPRAESVFFNNLTLASCSA